MDFDKLARINLIKGAGGGDPKKGLCIMEMVSYFDGADRVTDQPECACPMLTNIAISLNDRAPSQEARDTLKLLLPLLSGSRDEGARKARAWFIMRESVVRILAVRLDSIADKVPPKLAADLRAASDPATMRAAVQAARERLRAYANADADAYADAYANAYAYANIYANANAYANAQKRLASDRRWAFDTMREILTEALKLGAHGGLDLDAPATEARAEQLLELVK